MLTILFIFGVLCGTACPLPNAEYTEETANSNQILVYQKIPCADQIEWIENTIFDAEEQFVEYYTQLAKNCIDLKSLSDVKTQLDAINQQISGSLEKYNVELNQVLAVTADVTNQSNVCTEELNKFSIMSQNLSSLMQSLRPTVIDLIKKLGLSRDTVDGLDRSLGRMVMFIIDIGNHTVEHSFIEKGVETIIGKPEKGEMIGHTEEPASGIVENEANTPEGVPNPTTEPVYNEYEEEEDEKMFNDLINDYDPNIEKAYKELLEREQANLAEKQRLADAENSLLTQKNEIRLEEIKTSGILDRAELLL